MSGRGARQRRRQSRQGHRDEVFMAEALAAARHSLEVDEFPVGAIVVLDGEVLTRAHWTGGRKGRLLDHAEILALSEAERSNRLTRQQRERATLYSTFEPCAFCMAAAMSFLLGRIVFAAFAPDGGTNLPDTWAPVNGHPAGSFRIRSRRSFPASAAKRARADHGLDRARPEATLAIELHARARRRCQQVSMPFLLAQLSDTHIGALRGDAAADLDAAIEQIRRLPDHPDAIVITGDLGQTGTDAEYQRLQQALAPVHDHAPIYIVAGNQDDRAALRHQFHLPTAAGDRIYYAVDLGPVRLIVLDTSVPGELRGELGGQLAWLETQLAAASQKPTILAMHHPPLETLVPEWDNYGLLAADRIALRGILSRSPQVRRIIAGHFHRSIVGELAGVPVITIPSTWTQGQLALDFHADELSYVHEPAAIAIHTLRNGDLASHLQIVRTV